MTGEVGFLVNIINRYKASNAKSERDNSEHVFNVDLRSGCQSSVVVGQVESKWPGKHLHRRKELDQAHHSH